MGLLLAFFSVCLLGLIANWTAAFWLLVTIVFYVVIYTLILKTRTPHNIVIGGASGALPPVIGWACVTGSADLASFGLFLVIFMWTPAHFWALCMDQSDDYAVAGFPMMPSVRGEASTKRSIFLYTMLTALSSFSLIWMLDLGVIYLAGATMLNGYFVQQAFGVLKDTATGRRLFFVSIVYLFLLFLLMLVDRWAVGLRWI
jgi:protoheme IX farnesyltransferase